MTPKENFRTKVPGYMRRMMADLAVGLEDTEAIFGNLGHESRGLTALQEEKPTVKGSRGGYGWAQWTGPRRRAYENYCNLHGLNPASDEANYKYLVLELRGPEAAAITAVKAAVGLQGKVEAFEKAFERAGIKHYPLRMEWALLARDAYAAAYPTAPPVDVHPPEVGLPPKPSVPPKAVAGGLVALLLALAALIYNLVTGGN